jgi:hypothetical protein
VTTKVIDGRAPDRRCNHYRKIQESTGRVEDARGGVQDRRRLLRAASFVATLAEKSIARLASPLIEPDVTVSVIRLSDGFHGRHSQGRAAEVVKSQNAQFPEYGRSGAKRSRGTVQVANFDPSA